MKLLSPETLGKIQISNRIVMAPLTRMRSDELGVLGPLAAEYYQQRASAGLIISEATQIAPIGKGYPGTPGIYSADQVTAWKKVTQAVHEKDGKIVLQLWHVGRISHSSHHPEDGLPVAPSAICPSGKVYTAQWSQEDYETPRTLDISEIAGVVESYKHAASLAKEAGFDGVEVHAANGYLLDQFLQNGTNHRTDEYGGSVENRCKLLFEVLNAVTQVWDSEQVGVRLSPYGTFSDMSDSDPVGLFTYLIGQLNTFNLSYLHLIEPRSTSAGGSDEVLENVPSTATLFKNLFKGKVIMAGGFTRESGEEAVATDNADAVAFGRIYIANPDLVKRFELNAPLNQYNRGTFYGGAEVGYTDYPFLAE
jgi:N-ethylmaleimide reductase